MYLLNIILFFSSLVLSQQNEFSIDKIKIESGSKVLDLSDMDLEEKKNILNSIMAESNKFILYFFDHGITVYQILSVEDEDVKLELLDPSWFNNPTKLSSYGFYSGKPLFFSSKTNRSDEPSQIEIVSINEIMAIQILKNNSMTTLLFPLLITVVLMQFLGM